jgi:hypothetical protein
MEEEKGMVADWIFGLVQMQVARSRSMTVSGMTFIVLFHGKMD